MPDMLDLKHPQELAAAVEEPTPEEDVDGIAEPIFVESVAWDAFQARTDAHRFRHRIIMVALAIVGMLVAWWQSSWLTATVVLVGLGAWELWEWHARPMAVRLDTTGVTVDGRHLPYAQVASFDLHAMPDGGVDLSMKTSSRLMPLLRIPLNDQDPLVIRDLLLRYVPEERHEAPLMDWLIRHG